METLWYPGSAGYSHIRLQRANTNQKWNIRSHLLFRGGFFPRLYHLQYCTVRIRRIESADVPSASRIPKCERTCVKIFRNAK
jgi:hypothetical protein